MLLTVKNLNRFLILSLAALLFSCSKTENADAPDLKKDYFPLDPGHSVTYQVDSVVYDKFNRSNSNFKKTYSFQIKDTVTLEISSDNNYRTVYVERYKRSSPTARWVFQKVISRSITELRAEEFLDNQRFIRLTFPPVKNKSWNANTYNNLDKLSLTYKKIDYKDSINKISFDSTALVTSSLDSNRLSVNYTEELYAKHIGLVKNYKKDVELDFNTLETINGSICTMRIISYK